MHINADFSLAFLAFSSLVLLSLYIPPALSDKTGCTVISDSNGVSNMSCKSEHRLKRGTILATLPKLGKEWTLSLEFKPSDHTHNTTARVANIIQLSESTKSRLSFENTGIVSIWTHRVHDFHFSTAVDVGESWSTNFNGTQIGQWTTISISQQQVEREKCIKYRQFIRIDGKEISRRVNKAPQDYQQVDVFASNLRRSQPGVIKNFTITGCVSHFTQHGLDKGSGSKKALYFKYFNST